MRLGELRVQTPEYQNPRSASATAYVRPHDIDLLREPEDGDTTIAAIVSRVHILGSLVRLELRQQADDELAEVDVDRYAADPLQVGDVVFAKPRQLRVFLNDGHSPELPVWLGDGDGI